MKKIVILIISIFLFADDNYELKLYEKILPAIFGKKVIRVFTDKETAKILQNSDKFIISKNCDENVTVIIGKNFDQISYTCRNKPLFARNYRWYKRYENCFGAFYWRKGRPQLRFKKSRLKKLDITLPESLRKYEK